MVKFWRPVEKVGRRFSFINFWFSKIRRVSRIRGRTLISHQLQSFEARKKSFWIWVPYICIIDCVKKNWAETLRSWFSIGGVESTPPRGSHEKNMPWGIGLRNTGSGSSLVSLLLKMIPLVVPLVGLTLVLKEILWLLAYLSAIPSMFCRPPLDGQINNKSSA